MTLSIPSRESKVREVVDTSMTTDTAFIYTKPVIIPKEGEDVKEYTTLILFSDRSGSTITTLVNNRTGIYIDRDIMSYTLSTDYKCN
ncbi:hypothetical protein L4C54_23415 [Vibrio lamellibrachiae]|uniref:hypothetical protein n=1 Tax=Vibrio lamellibrachiae TaxID=2910253 RepID=UPI003D0C3AE7